MTDEKKRIKKLFKEGKLTIEQAGSLMDALPGSRKGNNRRYVKKMYLSLSIACLGFIVLMVVYGTMQGKPIHTVPPFNWILPEIVEDSTCVKHGPPEENNSADSL